MAVFKPAHVNDDAGTYPTDIFLTGDSLWIGNAGITTDSGARFPNVTIAKGSTINTAVVTFQAHNSLSVATCNAIIYGEAADNAAQFSTYVNFTGRTRTTAHTHWDAIPAWTGTVDYDTPDISAVIKEITDRAGWASGQALVLFFTDNSSSAGANREAQSYDTDTTNCARLTVTWTVPSAGSVPQAMEFYARLRRD